MQNNQQVSKEKKMKFVHLKKWWEEKKLNLALRVIASRGLSLVRIVKMSDGKEYIVASDGSLRSIGKVKK